MSDNQAAMSSLDLISLKNILDEIELNSVLLQSSQVLPIPTLIVPIDKDYQDRDRALNVSFVPLPEDVFPDVKLMQVYSELPYEIDPQHRAALEHVILAANLAIPLGNFAITPDNQVCFRYVHTIPKFVVLSNVDDALLNLMQMVNYILDTNEAVLERVAHGQMSAEAALKELREE